MTAEIRLFLYGLAIALIFGAGTAFGYRHWYTPEHDAHVKDLALDTAFKAQVAAEGAQAKLDATKKETDYATNLKTSQDAADSANAKLAAWVRGSKTDTGASRSVVPSYPETPAGTNRAGQVCFDRAGFDAAMAAGRAIVAAGEQAVIDRQQLTDGWPR